MANSKLATYVWPGSQANSNPRDHVIDTITIHHMAGNGTCEGCCQVLISRGGSVNYMIETSGRTGVMIDENKRAWTSSNRPNDMRAVTIEVANTQEGVNKGTWEVSEKAIQACIKLVADICKRNGIKKLIWSNNASDRINHKGGCNVTFHKDFAATGCPGPYLEKQIPARIIPEVNKILAGSTPTPKPTSKTIYRVQVGAYSVKANAEACRQKAIKAGFKDAFILEVKKD